MKPAKPSKWAKSVTMAEMFQHMKLILAHLDSLEVLLIEKGVLVDGELTRKTEKSMQDMEKLSNWQAKGEEDAKVQ